MVEPNFLFLNLRVMDGWCAFDVR